MESDNTYHDYEEFKQYWDEQKREYDLSIKPLRYTEDAQITYNTLFWLMNELHLNELHCFKKADEFSKQGMKERKRLMIHQGVGIQIAVYNIRKAMEKLSLYGQESLVCLQPKDGSESWKESITLDEIHPLP